MFSKKIYMFQWKTAEKSRTFHQELYYVRGSFDSAYDFSSSLLELTLHFTVNSQPIVWKTLCINKKSIFMNQSSCAPLNCVLTLSWNCDEFFLQVKRACYALCNGILSRKVKCLPCHLHKNAFCVRALNAHINL